MRLELLSFLSFGLAAKAITVAYDTGYDTAGRSLDVVACSDGENGLETRYGWKTQKDIPSYPYIGASFRISGWNDVDCGNCYSITYKQKTVNITAIDVATAGFVLSQEAMDELTDGHAEEFGRIDATTKKVALANCGL